MDLNQAIGKVASPPSVMKQPVVVWQYVIDKGVYTTESKLQPLQQLNQPSKKRTNWLLEVGIAMGRRKSIFMT